MQSTPNQMQRPMRGDRMNMTPEQRADQQAQRLTKQLGLSADQTAKVKALSLAQQQEMQNMRSQASASTDRQAMMQSMKASRSKYEEQLKGILTSDQYTKYTTMRDQRMSKMQEHRTNNKGGRKAKMKTSTSTNS